MKIATLAVVVLAASVVCGNAQGVDPLAPSSVTPKPVEPQVVIPKDEGEPRPKSPRPNPEGDKPINPDQPNLTIKAIIIVGSRAEIQEGGVPDITGLQVRGLPFLEGAEFSSVIQPFLGGLLTENRIRDLQDAIILFCRDHGRLLVDVILPEQNIENGVLQLWLLEGKLGKLTVKNEDKKWFADDRITGQLHLKDGESVDTIELTKDLNWLNNNPFRQVDAVFKPGERLGMTDVELTVEDRLPVRPYAGYEDSGTPFTGEDRLLFGFNWGDVFWLDHQLNYQYSTDIDFDLVKAHSASYVAPLPWRHTATLYGSHVDGKADFSPIGLDSTSAEGTSWQVSGRYSIPLPDYNAYRHAIAAGVDFKRSNNDLGAGGTNVLQQSDTDIFQFVLAYNGIMPDRFGRTSFSFEIYGSPGNVTANNDDTDFNLLRTAAEARYIYMRANAMRVTRLPYGLTWALNFWGQVANERLLPSEQLAVGGYSTVRGYDERVAIGDKGWIVNNEIRSPSFSPGELIHFPQLLDSMQFLAFFDYGETRILNKGPADGANPDHTLYSVGAGVRYTLRRNLTFRFDYGLPLTDKNVGGIEQSGRGHIGVLVSY